MATLSVKIAEFVNKSLTKFAQRTSQLIEAFDYEGYQSTDSEDLLLQLTETKNFVKLLNTVDRGGLTDVEIDRLIDFFSQWLTLSDVSIVEYTNLVNVFEENVTVPAGTYATISALSQEISQRQAADSALSGRVAVLEGFDPESIFPSGFFDNLDASPAVVFDDDPRLHTHSNKVTLDQINPSLLSDLQALAAHYTSINGPNSQHITGAERTVWNAKVSASQLSAALAAYALVSHTHAIGDVTGLEAVITQINIDIAAMAGSDGREVELQLAGTVLQWRYVGELTWNSLGDLQGPQGDAGAPFTVSVKGASADRLNAMYDPEGSNFTYLELDTGYLYYRKPGGGPATSSAGWETPIPFLGEDGWSPIFGLYEVSPSRAVFELIDWVGGSGLKPVLDAGLSPPTPIRWFVGPGGLTLYQETATNVKGPIGVGLPPIISASGALAGLGTYDDAPTGFIYLRTDASPQTVYIKLTDASADWSAELPWQGPIGPQGIQGIPGSGAGNVVNQIAHGIPLFRGVSYSSGYHVYAGGDTLLGVVVQVPDANHFVLQQVGFVTGLSGLTPNTLYYLQADGTISTTPSFIAIFFATTNTEGYLLKASDETAVYDVRYLRLAGGTMAGNILFATGLGIDTTSTGGSDVLNIGAVNAEIINIGRTGIIINILGAAINYVGTQSYITDKLITLNKGGSVGSGVGSGIEIEENALITGYIQTNGTRDGWDFKAPANAFTATLLLSNLTSSSKTYTLPNVTGGTFLMGGVTNTLTADTIIGGPFRININVTSQGSGFSGSYTTTGGGFKQFQFGGVAITSASGTDAAGVILVSSFTAGVNNSTFHAYELTPIYISGAFTNNVAVGLYYNPSFS